MVKKSTIIFTILAMLAFGACTCWGYTVSKWPVPGIPNKVFGPGSGGAWYRCAGYGGYGGYGLDTADTAGTADTATRGITADITAVMAQVTMDRAGAGSLLSSGAGRVSWLIWSCEKVPKGLPDNGHGCSSG